MPPSHAAADTQGWSYPARRALSRHDPLDDLTLRIPRPERRRAPRRAASRASRILIAATALAALASTGAALWASDASARSDIYRHAADAATRALVATGFGIDQVNVTGHRFALDSDILDAIDLPNVRTFADIDAAAVLKRIDRIAWIDKAQLTRVYPGTLVVQVSERQPAFLWTRGSNDFLVDATGRVLGPAPKNSTWRLPRVAGEGAPQQVDVLFAALARHPQIANRLAFAERVAERRWRLVLTSGSEINLGADRETEGLAELAARHDLLNELMRKPEVVDLRTPGRATARPVAALRQLPGRSQTAVR